MIILGLLLPLLCTSLPLDSLPPIDDLVHLAPLLNISLLSTSLLLSGKGINDLGQYDQCLDKGYNYFLLQYIVPDLQIPVSLGLCVPALVNRSMLQSAVYDIADRIAPKQRQNLHVMDSREKKVQWSVVCILFVVLLSSVLFLTLLSLVTRETHSWLHCFHLMDNMNQL